MLVTVSYIKYKRCEIRHHSQGTITFSSKLSLFAQCTQNRYLPNFQSNFRTVFDESCNLTEVVHLGPTDMRLNETYIIAYVNWIWTGVTVYIPFCLLLFLSTRIFKGLWKVKRNLNRHRRLEVRAGVTTKKSGASQEPNCTIQVKVTNENGIGKDY